VRASHLHSLRLMQLVCQRNSLNLRSFTLEEIAELSEILTVQKNARTLEAIS
jgi:hypothetical protein